jgi:hypothetical protein
MGSGSIEVNTAVIPHPMVPERTGRKEVAADIQALRSRRSAFSKAVIARNLRASLGLSEFA